MPLVSSSRLQFCIHRTHKRLPKTHRDQPMSSFTHVLCLDVRAYFFYFLGPKDQASLRAVSKDTSIDFNHAAQRGYVAIVICEEYVEDANEIHQDGEDGHPKLHFAPGDKKKLFAPKYFDWNAYKKQRSEKDKNATLIVNVAKMLGKGETKLPDNFLRNVRFKAVHFIETEALEKIGDNCLYGANNLVTFTMSTPCSNLKSVGKNWLSFCTSLAKTSFEGCTALERVGSCSLSDNETLPAEVPLALLCFFVELCKQDNDKFRLQGTMLIRKLISVETNPPIGDVVLINVCPMLVEFMRRDDFPELQFQAAWALSNVASGTAQHTTYIVELNALPLFIRLLDSPSEDCREQACSAVGNIAGQSYKFRDEVLFHNVMEPLLRCIKAPCEKMTRVQKGLWALSNMYRGMPQPQLAAVAPCLPAVAELLTHPNEDVVADACWAISYFSDGAEERIQAVLDAGVLEDVIRLLGSTKSTLIVPAIRTITNVVKGSNEQTQVVIDLGALEYFSALLGHSNTNIRKESCWIVCNMCAGTQDHITAVINAQLLGPVAKCMLSAEFELKKEAVWAIANITSGGTKDQVRYLIQCGCVIEPLCGLLNHHGPQIAVEALKAVHNLLQYGEVDKNEQHLDKNEVAELLRNHGADERIKKLQGHGNQEVSEQSLAIVETFFPDNAK